MSMAFGQIPLALLPSVRKSRARIHLQSFTPQTYAKYVALHAQNGLQCVFHMTFAAGMTIVQQTFVALVKRAPSELHL
jgi:hypothetical protein